MAQQDLISLFKTPNEFRLVVSGSPTTIREPINFSQLKVRLNRNFPEEFGVNWEFSDEEVSLEFDDAAGIAVIEAQYASKGINAEVYFQFGETIDSVFTAFFEGLLLLKRRRRLSKHGNQYTITCPVKRVRFQDKYWSRRNVEFELNTSKDLDGNVITPLTPSNIYLHSQAISKTFWANHGESSEDYITFNLNSAAEGTENAGAGNIFFGYPNQKLEQLKQSLDNSTRFEDGEITTTDNVPEPFFVCAEKGDYKFTVTTDMTFSLNVAQSWTNFPLKYELVLEVVRYGFTVHREVIATDSVTGDGGAPGSALQLNDTLDQTDIFNYSLQKNDTVRSYFTFQQNEYPNQVRLPITGFIRIDNEHGIKIEATTVTQASNAQCFPVLDVLNQSAKILTGQSDLFKSDYFETGQGKNLYLTTGKLIRGFTVDEYSPVLTIKKILDSLRVILAMGTSFEKDGSDNDIIRLEKMDYFFKNKSVYEFDKVSEYEEETFSDIIYNEIEVGFKKQAPGELKENQVLGDFYNKKTYSTEIISHENKLTLLSDVLMSGIALESTRRIRKEDDETKDTEYDDDLFFVWGASGNVDNLIISTVEYLGNSNGYAFKIPLNVTAFEDADVFQVRQATNSVLNGDYTIDHIFYSAAQDKSYVYVTSGPMGSYNEPGNIAMAFSSTTLVAEKNGPFEVVNNVDSPETTYNLRSHIARIMHNWGKFINTGLADITGDYIRFRSGTANNRVSTQFKSTEPYPDGDLEKGLLADNMELSRDDLYRHEKLGFPELVRFKIDLNYNIAYYIKQAFENKSPDDNNNGFLSVPDDDGQKVKIWLLNMSYMPADKSLEFEGLLIERLAVDAPVENPDFKDADFADADFYDQPV